MLKICKEKWETNKNKLREELKKIDLNSYDCNYEKLVELTIENILNDGENKYEKWDINNMHEIDDGSYQGTLLYLIPKDTYQPASYDYLITYIEYGSCSGCDTLQAIQEWTTSEDEHGNYIYTESQLDDFMFLCRDILFNIKRPFYTKFITKDEDDWSEVE